MHKEHLVHGRFTQAVLNDTAPLFPPWTADLMGIRRPEMDLNALHLSLELAASSYDLDLTSFLNAGWMDVSVQAESKLFTGLKSPTADLDTTDYVKNSWAWFRSKRDAIHVGFFSQVTDALRQFKASESGKALIMAKKQPDSTYVIAIGFMGTSRKIADWFANLRMTTQDGFHKGFYQLARQLESNEKEILFPTIAEELGLEKLTLADILRECQKENSRFRIWMAGHSQGGAVMQIYSHLKIHEDHVLPKYIVGYGFASPSCSLARAEIAPGDFPLFHIFNSDDYVPHMGSQVHYGLLMTYPANETLRETCYTWSRDENAVALRAKLRRITSRMVDTASCMEYGTAFMNVLLKSPVEDLHETLGELKLHFLPIKQILSFTDKMDYDLIELIQKQVNTAYRDLTGKPLDKDHLACIQNEIDALADEVGVKQLSSALGQLLLNPHHLVSSEADAFGSYQYITKNGVPNLRHSIWSEGLEPTRLWYEAEETPAAPDLQVRRRLFSKKRSAPAPKGIAGYSALKQ